MTIDKLGPKQKNKCFSIFEGFELGMSRYHEGSVFIFYLALDIAFVSLNEKAMTYNLGCKMTPVRKFPFRLNFLAMRSFMICIRTICM